MAEQSAVWKFFSRSGSELTCGLCGHKAKAAEDGSTSNLRAHLLSHHRITKEHLQSFVAGSNQMTFAPRASKGQIIRLLLKWLLADLRPLSLSDSNYFREFLALFGLPEAFIPDSRNLTRTYLPKLYALGKRAVCDVLKGSSSINCTFDAWTERYSTRSYVTLSVAIITDFKMLTLCLTTRHVKESHTADFLSEWVKMQLEEFGVSLQAPLLAATTDTTASMVNTVAKLGVLFVPCLAHTINLIMKDIWDIPVLQDFVARMQRICKFVRKSTIATEYLEATVIENKEKVLKDAALVYPCKDEARRKLPTRLKKMVKTRWNSTYNMLTRLWVLYPYLIQIVPRLLARKTTVPDELKEAAIADRENIMRIRTVLRDLVQATVEVQEQKKPALGPAFLTLFFARNSLLRMKQLEQGLSQRIAVQALESLNARIFSPESLFRKRQSLSPSVLTSPLPAHAISSAYDVAIIVAALDPRTSKILLEELRRSQQLPPPVRGSVHADPVKMHVTGLIRNAAELCAEPEPTPAPATTAVTADGAIGIDEEEVEEEVLEEDTTNYWRSKRARVTPHVSHTKLEDQIRQFLDEDINASHENPLSDPLEYWKMQRKRWPRLASVAARFLGVMPSSAEAERNFSTAGDIATPQRACLKPEHVDMLLFLAKNIRSGIITSEHLLEGVKD